MGAGNTCVFGDYEGLYYLAWDNFPSEYEDENGELITEDYEMQRMLFEDSLFEFMYSFKRKFKSFSREIKDEWLDNNQKIILENKLFYIVIEDNQWSMAIKLIQKEQSYYSDGNIEGLQKRHYKNYLKGIRESLFEQFKEIHCYGGAWTSGKIKRDGELN